MNHAFPSRRLPARPNIEQLKRQAKELLEDFLNEKPEAVEEIHRFYREADPSTFALHDAQLTLARSYGYDSWPKLKAFVDGVTVHHFIEAVRAGNVAEASTMLSARPELVNHVGGGANAYSAIHHAVFGRMADMVRILMRAGANPYAYIYPIRDATAVTIAVDRGYDEIVSIIREEERRRAENPPADQAPLELRQAFQSGDEDGVLEILQRYPELARFAGRGDGRTPLHLASALLMTRAAAWLIDQGANVNARTADGETPLDLAGALCGRERKAGALGAMVSLLRQRQADYTARSAVMLGDVEWLRARLNAGELKTPQDDQGWLLRIAVDNDRPEILKLLLDAGLDPDARARVDEGDTITSTWGMPLYACVRQHKHFMAEMLLERGADPNGQVYAGGTPLSEAFGQRDERMIVLLERYGGKANPSMAGLYRRKDLALKLLAEHGDASLPDDGFGSGPVAGQLIGAAAKGGDPEVLQLGLDRVDWPAGDQRWWGALSAPLGFWNHWIGPWCHPEWDRTTYLTCFRMILARSGPSNVRLRHGTTVLHHVVAMGDHTTAEERVAFAAALLDSGMRMDFRDEVMKSTPLGWACRSGREELVRLFLDRGADPIEADAEPWARPLAWAEKKGHTTIAELLRARGA